MQALPITMTFMLNLLHNIWLVYLDTAFWVLLGLMAAGLVKVYIPADAGLLLAGVSPGTVLVFLMAGPATNVAGIILVRKELGNRAAAAYLAGISLVVWLWACYWMH